MVAMYEFNDCGVCMNPDIIDLDKGSYLTLAEKDGRYIYGVTLSYNTGGYCSPCTAYKTFPTRTEARDNAFKEALERIEMQIGWYTRALSGEQHGTDSGYGQSLKQCKKLYGILKDKMIQKQSVQLELNFKW